MKINNSETDARKYAEIIEQAKKNAFLESLFKVSVQSYIDGLNAALRCKKIEVPVYFLQSHEVERRSFE